LGVPEKAEICIATAKGRIERKERLLRNA